MKQNRQSTLALFALFGLILGLGALLQSTVSAAPAALPWTPPSPAYRILVNSDGLYQVTYARLNAAGLSVETLNSLDPRTFRLFWMGEEVPIRVIGEEDGILDSTDVILFYGRGVDSLFWDGLLPTNKYTGTDVYWLTYGGDAGQRMAQLDGSAGGSTPGPFRHTVHLEVNKWYESALPFEHDADHWYWEPAVELWPYQTTSAREIYTFAAANIASGPYTGTLTFNLLGYTAGCHHLRLYVNGNLIHEQADVNPSSCWQDFDIYQGTAEVPQGTLINGTNKIKVELVNDVPGKTQDRLFPNWFEIQYYDTYAAEANVLAFSADAPGSYRTEVSGFTNSSIEVYDVSVMTDVQQVIGSVISGTSPYTVAFGAAVAGPQRYLALAPSARLSPAGIQAAVPLTSTYTPADLLSPATGADYLILSHANYWGDALRLAAHRDSDHDVALVDVQRIYDQFNGGLMSAESIHDFLAHAYQYWPEPRPEYVVLVGDGDTDLRNYKYTGKTTYIPPYLYLADPSLGETAAENRFVLLAGNDLMPDMHIGRLPVNSALEAAAMVDKIIRYETECRCQSWGQNLLFVTDDKDSSGGGDFYEYSDRIADGFADPPTNTISLVPSPPYTVTKFYLDKTCDVVEPGDPSDAPECRYMITNTLNMTGALLVSYVGHSTKQEWAAENLMTQALVSTLRNGPCLPIMLAMTCYEGSFHEMSNSQSLAEVAVRTAVNGAIASFSPTGFGLVTGHDLLEYGMFLGLFHEGITELGPAATRGKEYLLQNQPPNRYNDLVDTFLLLGDPGLKVPLHTEENCAPTGVRLVDLQAQARGRGVQLTWQTVDETSLLGFLLQRSPATGGEWTPIEGALIPADYTGSPSGARYEFWDFSATPGQSYRYLLAAIQLDGESELHGPVQATAGWSAFLPRTQRR